MGCGKSKAVIDTQDWLAQQGKITGTLVVAPNGVQANWERDELPTHCDIDYVAHCYWSTKQGKKVNQERGWFLQDKRHKVLCMPYSAMRTDAGKAFAKRFMTQNKTLFVLDESQRIKTPGAKVTKTLCAASKYGTYRRILSGSPITQGPFDVYAQVKFLDENFWKRHQLAPFSVFQKHFGVWKTAVEVFQRTGHNPGFNQLIGFKNIPELIEILKPITHRLTKESAGIVLPPKLYKKVYFDLTPAQMRVYQELKHSLSFEFPDGDTIETPETIVKILRLQQVTSGFVSTDDEPVKRIDDKNPRLDALLETLEDCPGKAIIWAKFTAEIDEIMAALGESAVRYDGKVLNEDRVKAILAFRDGSARYFVAKPQTAATGLTLHVARSVHYYSNSYNYEHRVQSEARAHRIGLKHPVTYFDYIGNYTIDNNIVANLRKKNSMASDILQDEETEWI